MTTQRARASRRAFTTLCGQAGLATGLAFLLSPGVRAQPGPPLRQLIPPLMDELQVPGLQIALLRQGRLDELASFGHAAQGGAKVGDLTLFEAASMSKPVFAHLAMQLVEQGRLQLDQPVAADLPDAISPRQPWADEITLRHLLSHTSGLPNWRPGGDDDPQAPLLIAFKPGSRYRYSGEGYGLAQRLVERVCGQDLQTVAQRLLFEPLGMARSSFVWRPGPHATGHDETGQPLAERRYTEAHAAYTLTTTAADYARFVAAMLDGPLLPPATRRAMLTHQVPASPERQPIPRRGAPADRTVFWGLGWGMDSSGQDDVVYHSGTNSSGFRAYSQFSPTRRNGLVLLSNGLSGNRLWMRLIAETAGL